MPEGLGSLHASGVVLALRVVLHAGFACSVAQGPTFLMTISAGDKGRVRSHLQNCFFIHVMFAVRIELAEIEIYLSNLVQGSIMIPIWTDLPNLPSV